ncbi:hypothetical protein TSMG0156 [Halocynthia phage JM-2012]|uniref:hypothetical protein n=1 Tax=Halocynthia phage JM-2012 TaxID=1173297 RepID=UPI00025C6978|nr:hypothetical protein TSMG0156 [Halocynthia phage JM-2012]AFI55439.1 hypothetical protein TSMG0156 [Halocynthia phage JM-2012]
MALKARVNVPDSKYFTDEFRRTIEDHLTILRSNTTVQSIDSGTGLKFNNNFHGLVAFLNIAPKYRYIVMRVNKITNPKLCGTIGTLYIPDFKVVETLISTLNLSQRDLF